MNHEMFLSQLKEALHGLPEQDVAEILADYEGHFAEGEAAGRSEEDVAAALGDPTRLAKEIRAEAKLRKFQGRRSFGNLIGVILALAGLATVDVIILLPLVCLLALIAFAVALLIGLIGIAGLWQIFSAPWDAPSFAHVLSRLLAGIGYIAGSIGASAALFLLLDQALRLLMNYARLHSCLLRTNNLAGAF